VACSGVNFNFYLYLYKVLKIVNDPLTQSPLLGLCSVSKIKNTTFRKPALLLPSGKEALNLVDPRDRAVTGLDIRGPPG